MADRTAVKNRLHSILAVRLLAAPEDLFAKSGRRWLETLAIDAEGRAMLDSDLRLLEAIEREIEGLTDVLLPKAYGDARVRLLMTLPGVDVTVAQTVLAALGDITRFRDGAHAASYLGLVPSTKQSANRCYHGPITKAGNGQARWLMVQAAQHVSKHPGPLGFFFRRLAKKKNRNVAVVATARKLVVIAWHLLTKNEPYRYAQPKTTENKFQRLRVKVTGRKRKTGPKAGCVPAPRQGQRTRTVKSLAQVFQDEGLPSLKAAPPGEARTVAASGTQPYVASLQTEQRVPRSGPGAEVPPA